MSAASDAILDRMAILQRARERAGMTKRGVRQGARYNVLKLDVDTVELVADRSRDALAARHRKWPERAIEAGRAAWLSRRAPPRLR